MDQKPKLNLRKFVPSKAGKGHLLRTIAYFIALVLLVSAICFLLSRATVKKKADAEPEIIENLHIELEQN